MREMEHKEGNIYCMATHPVTPSMSRGKRGRAIHLVKEENKTMCNMLVTEIVELGWLKISYQKYCRVCFPENK